MTDKNQFPLEPEQEILFSASSEIQDMDQTVLLPSEALPEGVIDWENELSVDEFDEDTPTMILPASAPVFTNPYVEQQIGADEHAYAYHGMTHPNEPQPDYTPYLYEEAVQQSPEGSFRDPQEDAEFSAMFFPEQTEEDETDMVQSKNRPARKGRPKRKKGDGLLGIPHLLASVLWIGIIVLIGTGLGRMLWVCAADVLAFGRQDRAVTITIESQDTIDTIADKLHQAGLIRYPQLFRLYAGLTVDEGEIATGTFTLNTLYDYHALVGGMSSTSSYRAVLEDVLIPEGYSCRQIFELLEEKGICTVAELEEYAANGEFADYWFLEGIERGDKYCLEGYLFPDTYDFYENSTPREALGKMLTGFEYRVNEQYYGRLAALNERLTKIMRENGKNEEYIRTHQLSFHDVVIVASMIEKETANNSESYQIASVIYNRLYDWGNNPAYLGIDAATIYAMGGDASNIDNTIDHPYNTYKNTGLTPGPISNPGLASLEAALNPADTNYYYYVLNPSTGSHSFSRTYEEHQKLVDKYRNS